MRFLYGMDNEPMSGLLHFIGLLLAIAGLILLLLFAAKNGTVWHIVGFSVFGTTLILLYVTSTLYHFFPITSKAKRVFKRIDHAMIYALIAGTYTPICLVTLHGVWGWTLFFVIWLVAAAGISIKSAGVRIPDWFSTVIYVVMGWLAVIAFVPLRAGLSITGFLWMYAGGVFYTVGAVIYSFDHVWKNKWFGAHELWHVFVMAGSFCHFWLMLNYVL